MNWNLTFGCKKVLTYLSGMTVERLAVLSERKQSKHVRYRKRPESELSQWVTRKRSTTVYNKNTHNVSVGAINHPVHLPRPKWSSIFYPQQPVSESPSLHFLYLTLNVILCLASPINSLCLQHCTLPDCLFVPHLLRICIRSCRKVHHNHLRTFPLCLRLLRNTNTQLWSLFTNITSIFVFFFFICWFYLSVEFNATCWILRLGWIFLFMSKFVFGRIRLSVAIILTGANFAKRQNWQETVCTTRAHWIEWPISGSVYVASKLPQRKELQARKNCSIFVLCFILSLIFTRPLFSLRSIFVSFLWCEVSRVVWSLSQMFCARKFKFFIKIFWCSFVF